jgi:hypothetical protein
MEFATQKSILKLLLDARIRGALSGLSQSIALPYNEKNCNQ